MLNYSYFLLHNQHGLYLDIYHSILQQTEISFTIEKKYRQAVDFWVNYVIIFSADNTVQNMSRCCDTIYYPAWQTVLALWFVLRFLKSRKERILIYD